MALGRSGAAVDEAQTVVRLCGTALFRRGAPVRFDAAKVSKAMSARDVTIRVDMGLGQAERDMLTCDYSYDYVKINAEYHT